jgi:hypothetical protein
MILSLGTHMFAQLRKSANVTETSKRILLAKRHDVLRLARQSGSPCSSNPFDLDVVRFFLNLGEIIFHLHAEPHFRT